MFCFLFFCDLMEHIACPFCYIQMRHAMAVAFLQLVCTKTQALSLMHKRIFASATIHSCLLSWANFPDSLFHIFHLHTLLFLIQTASCAIDRPKTTYILALRHVSSYDVSVNFSLSFSFSLWTGHNALIHRWESVFCVHGKFVSSELLDMHLFPFICPRIILLQTPNVIRNVVNTWCYITFSYYIYLFIFFIDILSLISNISRETKKQPVT